MKHKWIGGLVVAALLVVGSIPVHADPFTWSLDPDSGFVAGGVNTSTTMTSPSFLAKWGVPAFFGLIVTDTGAGSGALTDSLIVSLQKHVDLGSATALWPDSAWVNVQALPAIDPTRNFGKHHYLSADSVALGAYEVGGMMRFRLYKGGGQILDTVNGDYSLKVFFEQTGRE